MLYKVYNYYRECCGLSILKSLRLTAELIEPIISGLLFFVFLIILVIIVALLEG